MIERNNIKKVVITDTHVDYIYIIKKAYPHFDDSFVCGHVTNK